MTYVALTRSSTIAPIVAFLDGIGAPRDRLLATAGVPPWVLEDGESLIPAATPARLLGAAMRHAGVPNLGLVVGERTDFRTLGVFGRLLHGAPTLAAALESAVRYGTTMTANRPLHLRRRGNRVELSMTITGRFDPRDVDCQLDNQFGLGVMLAAVRLAAGPGWRPAEVHLQVDAMPSLRESASLAGARIAFRQPATMVAFPADLLARRLAPASSTAPPVAIDDWVASAPAQDLTGSVRQAIETLSAGEHYPSVRDTARFVGMSVRTLQRRLAAAGVSHDALVAQTRFAAAAAVLERTDARILDLALDLGYSDHANFTRAFRRWARCSPREYRSRRAFGACVRATASVSRRGGST